MTNDDKEALKEFLSGAGFVFGFVVFVSLVMFLLIVFTSQPTPSEQRFEVVDTYKGCEVVRYNPDGSARYSYFLNCEK